MLSSVSCLIILRHFAIFALSELQTQMKQIMCLGWLVLVSIGQTIFISLIPSVHTSNYRTESQKFLCFSLTFNFELLGCWIFSYFIFYALFIGGKKK